MNALISIFCGLAAWAIPGIAVLSGKRRMTACAASGWLCAAALYLQIRFYETEVILERWADLMDICHGETIAATVMIVVALAFNLFAWVMPRQGGEHR